MKKRLVAVGLSLLTTGMLAACGEAEAEKQARAAEDEACKADIQCLANRLTSSPEVGLLCGNEIERLAKADVTWNATLLQQRFTQAAWTGGKKDGVTLFGDSVQFQNGQGANVHMVYECDVDPTGSLVLAVRARPGRL